jgi:hypothetical protein
MLDLGDRERHCLTPATFRAPIGPHFDDVAFD